MMAFSRLSPSLRRRSGGDKNMLTLTGPSKRTLVARSKRMASSSQVFAIGEMKRLLPRAFQ